MTSKLKFLIFLIFVACAHKPPAIDFQKESLREEFLQKGHSFLHQNNLDEAIKYYEKSLEIDQSFEAAQLSLKRAYAKKEVKKFQSTLPGACGRKEQSFEVLKSCAQNFFVVNGEPISPSIINSLASFISDEGDQISSIDLLGAQGSNRFFDKEVTFQKYHQHLIVTADMTNEFCTDPHICYFSYKVEGKTKNGIYVLSTREQSGGTGIFVTFLFLKIKEDAAFDFSNLKSDNKTHHLKPTRKRLLLEKIGEDAMGDCATCGHEVKVKDNQVTIEVFSAAHNFSVKKYNF